MKSFINVFYLGLLLLVSIDCNVSAFAVVSRAQLDVVVNSLSSVSSVAVASTFTTSTIKTTSTKTEIFARLPKGGLSDARRKELGVSDDEDEYDLDVALNANTDPLITKIIAGSAILAILTLLVV
eukprot:CAMPEP_0178967746 /NCGR_PEP_ID=MMETSP0789-20121207/17799_1 /TAXON_ID=3005 /ORGANISM="Rhizosolenia setigera, Strain CCMP 1694" /LENGTH=124 /DNA_ID=CAMNT_0020653457 /DNA_START=26 /DNA_END=397 /DNA_ORIENTATION=-